MKSEDERVVDRRPMLGEWSDDECYMLRGEGGDSSEDAISDGRGRRIIAGKRSACEAGAKGLFLVVLFS